jgi:glycosyltransferase involved in cell wall biosynthesis
MKPKPHIIVIAVAINPRTGGEPGKGWWWIDALRPYFTLHVVTSESNAADARTMIGPDEEIYFHLVQSPVNFAKPLWGYMQYWGYLKKALGVSQKIKSEFPIVGACHLTLGSFRVLPRYDKLGIPYMVGPVGGGECTPLKMLWSRPVPLSHKISETLRPLINQASALVPPVHACLKHADLVLATSDETAVTVKRIGARNAKAVFPDSYDFPIDAPGILAEKQARMETLKEKVHLLWQGRLLWWKGPDIALEVLKAAVLAGLKVELTMVGSRPGSWETGVGKEVKALAEKMGLLPHIRFLEAMSREAFLAVVKEQNGFLGTSLHDSGGIPLVEAESRGIPCLTLGLGGNRDAACPEAGVSGPVRDVEDYVQKSVACIARWQQNPSVWLDECQKAIAFAQTFTNEKLKATVRELIIPLFNRS